MNLTYLKKISSAAVFQPGTEIVTENDDGHSMYIILDGTVAISKNAHELTELGAGDFFGEMSLFLDKKRSATVTAKTKVKALKINKDNAIRFFRIDPKTAFEFMKILCERLDELNFKYIQMSENFNLMLQMNEETRADSDS